MGGDSTEHKTTANDAEAGVAFGPLKRALREHRYPVTAAELTEQYGAAELETPTATERFGSLLEECDETRFRKPREVRDAVLDALGDATGTDPSAEAPDDWARLS